MIDLATASEIVIGVESPELISLPDRINAAVREAEDCARGAMRCAMLAGNLLTQAKALLPHGQWNDWLETHCTVAPRTARAYMQIARRMAELPAVERQRVADLPLRRAIAAITTPPTAPPSYGKLIPVSPPITANRKPDEAEALARHRAGALIDCADSIRGIARNVRSNVAIKRGKIITARKKLQAARDALDAMLIGAEAVP